MINRPIFVFGSNLAGRHGKGAALHARKHCGAIYGVAFGPQGDSYAIPTKDEALNTLPISRIKEYVDIFIDFALAHRDLTFQLTAIGTGLAGYSHDDIRPLFEGAPDNVIMPHEWAKA